MEVREPSARYLTPQTSSDLPDWQDVKLGAVASFRTGPFGSALHKSDYVFGGVPVVNPMQIEDGRIKPTEWMSVAEEAVERLSEFRLKNGDVVIGRRGEMGRCAFVQAGQEGWLCGTGSMIVRPGHSLDGRFAQRVLSSNQAVRAIESASVGTTMINLNQRTLAELNLWIPVSVDEQSLIADALSDADALIDSLEQLLTKKRQIKQGAMQELFKPVREPLRTVKLEQISGFITKGSTPTTYGFGWEPDGIVFLRSECVSTHGLDLTQSMFISVRAHSALRRSAVSVGDLLMTITGNVGRVVRATIDCNINQHIARIRITDPEINTDFVYHQLSCDEVREELESITTGQAYPQLSLKQVRERTVQIPPRKEQDRTATTLSEMDDEIALLESRLTKARALKQAMVQTLLTGRIRLLEPTA